MAEMANLFVADERLVLSSEGVWLANGQEITHERTCELFFKALKRGPEGYFLQVSHETKRVEVEDTAAFVKSIEGSPDTGFTLHCCGGGSERLAPETLRYQPGRLTCRLGSGEEAKFLRGPYHELLSLAHEGVPDFSITIQGINYTLLSKTA